MFPEVYYKIRSIFPNVIASSELIIFSLKSHHICKNDISSTMLLSTPPVSQDVSATLHNQHLPSTFGFTHNNWILVTNSNTPSLFSGQLQIYWTIHALFSIFQSSYVSIRPFLLSHGKFVGFLTVLTQSLLLRSVFAENTGRLVRHDILHNTVVVFPSTS